MIFILERKGGVTQSKPWGRSSDEKTDSGQAMPFKSELKTKGCVSKKRDGKQQHQEEVDK